MSKKLKLSPWHDGSVSPVNDGWYEVRGFRFARSTKYGKIWRIWKDKKWRWIDCNGHLSMATVLDNDKWRGVLK